MLYYINVAARAFISLSEARQSNFVESDLGLVGASRNRSEYHAVNATANAPAVLEGVLPISTWSAENFNVTAVAKWYVSTQSKSSLTKLKGLINHDPSSQIKCVLVEQLRDKQLASFADDIPSFVTMIAFKKLFNSHSHLVCNLHIRERYSAMGDSVCDDPHHYLLLPRYPDIACIGNTYVNRGYGIFPECNAQSKDLDARTRVTWHFPPGMQRPREQNTTAKPVPSTRVLATDLANVLIKSQLQLDEVSAMHSSDRELVRWDVIFLLQGFRLMRLQDEALHAIPLEAVVHESDVLYKLYRDCLQYFKKRYPFPLESPCSILAAFRDEWRRRNRQPTEFLEAMARVVMEVVSQSDNWPVEWPTMHHHQFHLVTGPDSLMTFLAALVRANEILAKVEGFTHWHLSCELLNGWLQRYFYEPEFVYQALFIDWLTQASWFELGRWRRTTGVKPKIYGMFGKRSFIEEAEMTEEAKNSQAEPVSEQIPSLETENLPGLAGNGCALNEVFAGIPSPVDIPWLDGDHNGHRHCGSLREYAMVRRPWHEGLLTVRWDDLGLWLSMVTFGLLEAVTHTRIAESLLLVPGDRRGRYVLSGTRLLQILAHWRATLRSATADPETHLHRGRIVAGALRDTLSTLDGKEGVLPLDYSTAGSAASRAGLTDAEGRDLHYSVALFVVSLGTIAALQVWSTLPELDYVRMILRRQVDSRLVGFFDFECRRRMRSEGWCPYTSEKIWRMHPNPLVTSATLARLPRPGAPNVSRREHAHCTLWTCSFHNLPTYTRRHIDASCQCDYAKPSLDHIAILLQHHEQFVRGHLACLGRWHGEHIRGRPALVRRRTPLESRKRPLRSAPRILD
ncbi:hypothetical protein NUW54_g10011 [Trametes sanguinea]|uniref:Uncharacterized protein n=1 Tax=Trametes sanguinea TaxID=158606 RepID=A0ACC1P3R1_9APHY|nr:hypothetical protein NUW54_g10011 [Trametes sanguinea]